MSETLADLLVQMAGSTTAALKVAAERAHAAREVLKDGADLRSPADLHDRLLLCRHVTDQLEEEMAGLIMFMAKVNQAVADRKGEIEDAEIAAKVPKEEFASARDKGVMLNAATISARIKLRKAERMQREMASTLEYVRTLHRGADSTRRDVETRLRAVTLTSHLERGGN